MTLKHQLQYLFFDTDSTPELSSKNTEWLSTILTNLQTMANTFDDMQLNKHRSSCIKFTPAQYRIMYNVPDTTPPSKALNNMTIWYEEEGYYYKDKQGEGKC